MKVGDAVRVNGIKIDGVIILVTPSELMRVAYLVAGCVKTFDFPAACLTAIK